MFEEQIQEPDFVKFCELVKKQLGEASTEVLHAWYFDTFNLKEQTKTQTTTNKKSNENKG